MTFLEALRKARPLIASGKEIFICQALDTIGGGKFKHRIMYQLGIDIGNDGEFYSYGTWLKAHHHTTWLRMTQSDIRDGRLQWIDHMIRVERSNL